MNSYHYYMDIAELKVINIKSEILCRSAEDDFYYFNKINLAYKKLKEAVNLTPNHLKSLIFLADVTFIKGYIKKALDLYLKAETINNKNIKILASAANCLYITSDYTNALKYCNKAISMFDGENYIVLGQVFEIKMNILILQKEYKQAYETLKTVKRIFNTSDLKSNSLFNYEFLNEKISIQKKIQKSNLKIV